MRKPLEFQVVMTLVGITVVTGVRGAVVVVGGHVSGNGDAGGNADTNTELQVVSFCDRFRCIALAWTKLECCCLRLSFPKLLLYST